MVKVTNIDLHMHTTVSDGTDTPLEIVGKVMEAGVDLFSVTDHDAYKAGLLVPDYLADIEPEVRPAFIRGVEFSCEDELGKYHILGYGYDPDSQGIRDVVEAGHALRKEKLQGRIDFLKTAFYIPEELRIRSEIRFEKKGSGWLPVIAVVALIIVVATVLCWLLPDIVQFADNLISVFAPK